MKFDTDQTAIATYAVLAELLTTLMVKGILDQGTINSAVIEAARKMNQTKDPALQEAAKAALALYNR